jgi:mono/diheme cytochrome c family protein
LRGGNDCLDQAPSPHPGPPPSRPWDWWRSHVPVNFSRRLVATGLCVVAVSAVTAVFWWRSANVGAVQRGADLAVAQGCLGCHGGPGASPLLPRPLADLDDVDPATLREWILDGMPRRVRQDPERREALEAAAIRMPAWRGRLSDGQVDDLVDYVRALADIPEDPAARKGHAIAERLGCFRCHGPGGRGAGSNPGSLKGYIPPWDGRDFAELVADDSELREWILSGRPQRLQANPLARFFLDRQAIRMPAFRGQVTEEELRALEAYIRWLRPAAPVPGSGSR